MCASPIPHQCATCSRFHGEYAPSPEELLDPYLCDAGSLKCDAFPEGIPWPIQEGEFDHAVPYAGDHGIQYVAKPKLIGGLIKVANPEEGTTYEDYWAVCKALGVEPQP